MEISKNLTLHLNCPEGKQARTLVVILTWMGAIDKIIMKYTNLYLGKKSDVLVVKTNIMDVLWPSIGAEITGANLAEFFDENKNYEKILLHGFSAGGFLWGGTMLKIKQKKQYHLIFDKIVGQVWDSLTFPSELPQALAQTFSPNSRILGLAIWIIAEIYTTILYYPVSYFYNNYEKSFLQTLLKAPALLFFSKSDKIGIEKYNWMLEKTWKNNGLEVEVNVWENSPHVGHFVKYPDEYRDHLTKFLTKIEFWQIKQINSK